MTSSDMHAAWNWSDTELFIKFGDVFVPRRQEQISIVCDLLSELTAPHVLDICAGQGRLAEAYLRAKPDACVTLMDNCPEMLTAAQTRLQQFEGRYHLMQANIEERSWRQHSSYNAVMSSLAVHHLNAEGKRTLYKDIHDMLVPGGVFAMVDLVEPAGLITRSVHGARWAQEVRSASLLHGCEEAAAIFEQTGWNYYRLSSPDPVDKPSSVAEHVDWLRDAGFVAVDVAWMYAGHAVFTAEKELAE